MKLVIAEKPSLARSIIEALKIEGETFKQDEGREFFKSQNYYVTSVFGHIFRLLKLEEYEDNKEKNMWDICNLPYFPDEHKFTLIEDRDISKRYKAIKSLVQSSNISEIIHCGDPDREGQLIIDLVLENIRTVETVSRPLLKSLDPKAIKKAFDIRKDNSLYENLKKEALTRTYVDFDFGINLSRYATKKVGTPLNVGRVIGAILTELYRKDKEIKEFKVTKYLFAESNINDIKLKSQTKFSEEEKDKAGELVEKLNREKAIVKEIKEKKVIKKAPKLFSLTSLQAIMNELYSLPPDKTYELAQSLYEKGLSSYPRTETEYLTEEDHKMVKDIIDVHGSGELIFKNLKTIFDSKKTGGHTAIIPTCKKAENLTEEEEKCYSIILNRFKAVFTLEEAISKQREVVISLGEVEEFILKGEVTEQQGFRKFENQVTKDKDLPNMKEGDVLETLFVLKEGETTPPSLYSVKSLGKWMQNPFIKDMEDEDDNYQKILAGLQIGTEATRSGIIKKAIDKKYMSLNKSNYKIEEQGIFLVETCNKLGIDMSKEKTANLGKITKDVYTGENTIEGVLMAVRAEIDTIIKANIDVPQAKNPNREVIGTCPICGKDILENKKAFGCTGYKDNSCNFTIWKSVAGKGINKKDVVDLLQGKETRKIAGFKNKAGKTFDAKLKLDNKKVVFVF